MRAFPETEGLKGASMPNAQETKNLSTLAAKFGGFDVRKEWGGVHDRRKAAARKGSAAGKESAA